MKKKRRKIKKKNKKKKMNRTTILSRLLQQSPSSPSPIPKTLSLSLIYSSNPFSSRRKRDDENSDSYSSSFILNRDPESPPKLLVVQPRLRPDSLLRSKLSEALNLANSLEEQRDGSYAMDFVSKKNPPHLVVQNPSSRSLKADMYFGPGTVDNIKYHLKALESKDEVDAVFVNTILSGIQQRNLEMAWRKPVLDRVGLIIEIFNAHAETKEAKLQSELAALMYKRSRLVRVRGPGGRLTFGTSGEAEVVSARGRRSGGRGFISGAGETELQLQRRRIQERRNYLLSQIEEVRRTRAIQRSARRRHGSSHGQGLATVAVVGYTNAGKSTLVSALSGTDVYSDDRLFATVDPRLRSLILPSGKKALLSDTVGFISDLPVQLVEAFHATLEEVVEADLLVHVLDASAPDLDDQRATVLEVLQQIGVAEEKMQNMIEVWNKIDLIDKNIGVDESLEQNEWLNDESGTEEELLSGDQEENDETILGDECLSQIEEEDDEIISGEECVSDGEEEMDEAVLGAEDGFTSNQDEHVMVSDPSEECLENADDQGVVSSEQKGMTDVELSPSAKGDCYPIKTSAVLGIGLHELLNVIDKKLSARKSILTRSFGPFDRKWRSSYSTENEKVASQ